MILNKEQLAILDHTAYGSVGGLYCGDSSDMQALVSAGLMSSTGRKSFVPDEYFKLTALGRIALAKGKNGTTEKHG